MKIDQDNGKFISISNSEYEEDVLRFTDTQTVKKKQNLLAEGQLCRHQYFVLKDPLFVQRIPQYLLASFPCFTPEYLSELRKKASS